MKKITVLVFLIAFLTSCGANTPHNFTKDEKAVLDSLQRDLNCEISISSNKELLRFTKPYDFEITLSNIQYNSDSLSSLAQYVAQKYYPYLNEKERYKSLIITIQSKTEGVIGVGNELSYTFDIEDDNK